MVVMGLEDCRVHVFCSSVRVGGKERAAQDFGVIVVTVVLVHGILEFLSSRSLFRGDCGAWRSVADLACGALLQVCRSDPHRSR